MGFNTTVLEKLKTLPDDPGVYLMKNEKSEVIYVGKAKSLKSRVRSYFTGINTKDLKTKILLKTISDFEIILTHNEAEALLLERTLIKHHHPHYNILLKDGKEYPFLRIDFQEPWPRIEKVRRRKEDGAFYLGPFSHAGYLATAMKLMGKIFPVIRCSRHEFRNAKRVCNYYHMNMCLGPCNIEMDREEYLLMLRNAISFLSGKSTTLEKDLKNTMQRFSDSEEFEKAAKYRDQIQALSEISKRQTAVVKTVVNADIIAILIESEFSAFHVLMVREQKIIGGENFIAKALLGDRKDALRSFILQYYETRPVPPELILNLKPDGLKEMLPFLGPDDLKLKSHSHTITVPLRGSRKDLLDMAIKNCQFHLKEHLQKKSTKQTELVMLRDLLKAKEVPEKIECIDISHTGGKATVGSIVCFLEGKPAKNLYRYFSVKEIPDGKPDDFASIYEIVTRRIMRGEREDDLPDLILIDGGKGQLSAALRALSNFPSISLPIISIAKARSNSSSIKSDQTPQKKYDRIFIPGEDTAIPLKIGSPVFRLLTQLRDEAHRFAITNHRKKRAKNFYETELDEIAGVGPVLKKRLLNFFGGIAKLKLASLEQLRQVKGINDGLATSIHAFFQSNQSDEDGA